MKLNAKKLRAAMNSAGKSVDDLVEAIDPSAGRKAKDELASAIRNWLTGRDHPRCRPSQIESIAQACGVSAQSIAAFQSRARFVRSAPQKTRLVADLIRGRGVGEALDLLEFNPKRATVFVRKVLNAAIADAESQGSRIDRLVVSESRVDEGVIIKRFQPKDRGRAHPIQKKTSHITVSVEEAA